MGALRLISELPILRIAGDFKESDHPRKDDGKFGEGTGEPAKNSSDQKSDREEVHSSIEELEDYDEEHEPLHSKDMDSDTEEQINSQIEAFEDSYSDEEQSVIGAYCTEDFTGMRQSEVDGFSGEFGKDAKMLAESIARVSEESDPVLIYRGLQLDPEQVKDLLESDELDLLATSSFAARPKDALDFALGKSQGDGKPDPNKMQVVIAGELKCAAVANSRSL